MESISLKFIIKYWDIELLYFMHAYLLIYQKICYYNSLQCLTQCQLNLQLFLSKQI